MGAVRIESVWRNSGVEEGPAFAFIFLSEVRKQAAMLIY
jgi:hypothetical protein